MVRVAYTRDQEQKGEGGGTQKQSYVFIEVEERQVAKELIAEGLAYPLKLPQRDENFSGEIDALFEAERSAKAAKKGQMAADFPVRAMEDVVGVGNQAKVKEREETLIAQGKVPVVVEYVFNAGRLKIRQDNLSLYFALVLAGLKVPQPGRVDKKREAEPLAEEGTQFVRDHLMQRDATVQVLGTDKQGNCHGLVWCKIDGKETLLSEALSARGFAHMSEHSPALLSEEQVASLR